MHTEREIIYGIWNIVRGGTINQDDKITERLLRSFLRIHRSKHISRNFNNGALVPDEVFQTLGSFEFTKISDFEFISSTLPKIVRLQHNAGIKANKDGYILSVLNSDEYNTAKVDRFDKHFPKLSFIDNKLKLYIGKKKQCSTGSNFSLLNNTIDSFLNESLLKDTVTLNLEAVLVNTDDQPGYDFTESIYPFPDELVEDLINSVNAREFNFYLKVGSDETTEGRENLSEKNTREEI